MSLEWTSVGLAKRILNAKPEDRRERGRPTVRRKAWAMMLQLWGKETGKT
jgi:hypothetical protein